MLLIEKKIILICLRLSFINNFFVYYFEKHFCGPNPKLYITIYLFYSKNNFLETNNSKIDDELFHQNASTSSSINNILFQRPPFNESFISPSKQQCKGFLSSSSSNVNKNCLKTPSLALMMEQSAICKNVGNLLLMI